MLRNLTQLSRVATRFYCVSTNRTNILNVVKEQSPNINVDEISSALDQYPQLGNFAPSLWEKTFHFLIHQQNFPHESCIQIVSSYPQIFTTSLDTTFKQLEAWRACQFGERRLQDLITKHPALIQHGNERHLKQRTAFLLGYVTSHRNVWRILMSSPTVILESDKSLTDKFTYLIEVMGIDVSEIVKCDVFIHDLIFIKTRHIFLDRLGMFKKKDPKKSVVNDKNPNPKLSQIVDTSDKRFATKVCFVTLEEYEVFQELLKREWERQDINDEDDNFDELQADRGIDGQ